MAERRDPRLETELEPTAEDRGDPSEPSAAEQVGEVSDLDRTGRRDPDGLGDREPRR